ncbi:DUF1376 domain-containing protein [Acidithiobacillus ferriphilus]|uniref:DUF1376 domain-containing protein n=1 Tax=Acidithiobacillus ferriphilus TaxID=1689834 RepID=UPI001C06F301|nr:DUF1376 domain-containing protein [Acidithiobacillus ferriphilus]MBU2854747.1 YdaU family protein [Acidithiobacillus ferriphilus]
MDDGNQRRGLWISVPEYLAEMSNFRPGEHAALFLLLLYAQEHGPVPDNDAVLARIGALSMEDWQAARPRLAPFFEQRDGCWTHVVMDWVKEVSDES